MILYIDRPVISVARLFTSAPMLAMLSLDDQVLGVV